MISVRLKPNLLTPAREIRTRVVEGHSKLDQHIERHHQPERILTPRVIDEGFDGDERAPFWQASYAFRISIILFSRSQSWKDHPHCDHISFGKRIFEKIDIPGLNSVGKTEPRNLLYCDRGNHRQIRANAAHVLVTAGHHDDRTPPAPPMSHRFLYFEK